MYPLLLLSHTPNYPCLALIYLNLERKSNTFTSNFSKGSQTLSYAVMAILPGNDRELNFTSYYTLLIPQQKVHLQETATGGNHVKVKITIESSRASIDRMLEMQ